LGVSVQQHLSVCCPDVLAHAQDQVLDMKSSNRGRHKQHDYGGEHDSFDGGGPLRGWLCVGCGRHFGRAGYGYYCTNYIHVLNTLMQWNLTSLCVYQLAFGCVPAPLVRRSKSDRVGPSCGICSPR
jgi:hypothetical protein